MAGLNIVEVQFRRAGRLYDFLANGLNLHVGDQVLVDSDRGASLGTVARVKFMPHWPHKDRQLKAILRVATPKELEKRPKVTEEEAVSLARKKASDFGLAMRILKAEHQFGSSRLVIYFSAPGRVDFRDLVKELAGALRSRVELKQVGARDEAKLIGGTGICGREFCCSSWLREFMPVSIKMAKNQNLALNPTKVSGGCGRLLCCLTYENDQYTAMRKEMPGKGTKIRFPNGKRGVLLKTDLLNQSALIEDEDGAVVSVKLNEVEIIESSQGAAASTPNSQQVDETWGDDLDLSALMDDDLEK